MVALDIDAPSEGFALSRYRVGPGVAPDRNSDRAQEYQWKFSIVGDALVIDNPSVRIELRRKDDRSLVLERTIKSLRTKPQAFTLTRVGQIRTAQN